MRGGGGDRERACSGQMGGGPRAAVGTDARRAPRGASFQGAGNTGGGAKGADSRGGDTAAKMAAAKAEREEQKRISADKKAAKAAKEAKKAKAAMKK